jgi:hypothetical protein
MCGFFSDPNENRFRAFVPASEALVERTRLVEFSMKGEPVPEAAWQAFFSPACAAIEWAHFERMFLARKAAVAYLAVQSSSRRRQRPASSFRCIAD